MAEPALRLVVDEETGEVVEQACEECARLEDAIAGLQRDVKGWAVRYAQLKRDREAAAKSSEEWEPIKELFGEWQRETGHTRSPFTVDRFEAALPFYRNAKYGPEKISVAIKGIAFDHYSRPMKNGRVKHFDDWVEQLFKNADKFEEYVNRAPRESAA